MKRRVVVAVSAVISMLSAFLVVGGTPAHAAVPTYQIYKMKTTWGGGWALNVGFAQGTFYSGASARIFWNQPNDWNNRWVLEGNQTDGFLYRNLYTKKCLFAAGSGSPIIQRTCNAADDYQHWYHDTTGFLHNVGMERQHPGFGYIATLIGAWTPTATDSPTVYLAAGVSYAAHQLQVWVDSFCGTVTNGIVSTPSEC